MTQPSLYSVITTIQAPTAAVRKLNRRLLRYNGKLLIIGDSKGPFEYPVKEASLVPLAKQLSLDYKLPKLLPTKHYTRKNVGYLLSISHGAGCIYETDDDNCPTAGWQMRDEHTEASMVTRLHWCNVYRYFSDELIWPRGLPLDQIRSGKKGKMTALSKAKRTYSPIQQGLVNRSADVDAVWRLVLDKPVKFNKGGSVALAPGVWCPFNSQNTWWWPAAYPLMYLPSGCTFRMTDIWRSFIAQRCIWALGGCVVFHAPDAVQDRNEHRLIKDFEDEVPGYLLNDQFRGILDSLTLAKGLDSVGHNMLKCYEALVEKAIFPKSELKLVKAWLRDLATIQQTNGAKRRQD